MKVRCIVKHPDARTNGFTNGRAYEVIGREGNGLIVKNDNGHERFILPGLPSPHLTTPEHGPLNMLGGKPGGTFEVIE